MIDLDELPPEVKALAECTARNLRDAHRRVTPDPVISTEEQQRRIAQCRAWRDLSGFGSWVEPAGGKVVRETPERARKSRIMIIYRSRFRRGAFIDCDWRRSAPAPRNAPAPAVEKLRAAA